jgi:nucleotide-binding universal stress UspA family protein
MTTQEHTQTLVIGYDGSEGADRAIDAAAVLFSSADVVIVTVVEPVLETVAGAELEAGLWMNLPDAEAEDLAAASQSTEAGAARAKAQGLKATERAVVGAPVWSEVAGVAADVHADAIVVGSRGHGAIAEALLGSVSHALARHGGRPVLVVPPEKRAPGGSTSSHAAAAKAT